MAFLPLKTKLFSVLRKLIFHLWQNYFHPLRTKQIKGIVNIAFSSQLNTLVMVPFLSKETMFHSFICVGTMKDLRCISYDTCHFDLQRVGEMSAEIKRVRAQMEENEDIAILMRGLRGQNLTDSQFAADDIQLRLVEVCSFLFIYLITKSASPFLVFKI